MFLFSSLPHLPPLYYKTAHRIQKKDGKTSVYSPDATTTRESLPTLDRCKEYFQLERTLMGLLRSLYDGGIEHHQCRLESVTSYLSYADECNSYTTSCIEGIPL